MLTYLSEVNRTKDEIVKEFRDLFGDDTDSIVNWIMGYVEKHMKPEENKDLVEEIIQEKSESSKIGSQIVNPNNKNDKKDDKKKNIFNSAIENIRDDQKRVKIIFL